MANYIDKIKKNGVEYTLKDIIAATIWETNYDLDDLPQALLNSIKNGDVIVNADKRFAVVVKDEETINVYLVGDRVAEYDYNWGGSEEGWYLNDSSEIELWEFPTTNLKDNSANQGKFLQVQEDGNIAAATISSGSKLYKHSIDGLPGPSIAVLITASPIPLTGQTLFTLLENWQENLIVGYIKITGKPWGMIRGTNLSGTSGSIYVDNYNSSTPSNLAYVAGSVITDVVTEL